MNRRLYLAGAIGNGHTAKPRVMYSNVRYAETYYYACINGGWTPFCPHLSYHAWIHFPEDVQWERWLAMDLDYIDSVAALVRLPNESIGADLEVEYAVEKGIPVIHADSPEDMIRKLEQELGKPELRPELKHYTEKIKKFKQDLKK